MFKKATIFPLFIVVLVAVLVLSPVTPIAQASNSLEFTKGNTKMSCNNRNLNFQFYDVDSVQFNNDSQKLLYKRMLRAVSRNDSYAVVRPSVCSVFVYFWKSTDVNITVTQFEADVMRTLLRFDKRIEYIEFTTNGSQLVFLDNGYSNGISSRYSVVTFVSPSKIVYPSFYEPHWQRLGNWTNISVSGITQRPCQFHDVGCWVVRGISSVVDSIQSFFDNIKLLFLNFTEFLSHIFIPGDDNILSNFFDDFMELIKRKLGFLTFPFEFFARILGSIVQNYGQDLSQPVCNADFNQQSSFCDGICANRVLGGSPLCFRIYYFESAFPLLWSVFIPILRVSLLITIIFLIRSKYLEVLSS